MKHSFSLGVLILFPRLFHVYAAFLDLLSVLRKSMGLMIPIPSYVIQSQEIEVMRNDEVRIACECTSKDVVVGRVFLNNVRDGLRDNDFTAFGNRFHSTVKSSPVRDLYLRL
jgi:hypothetical protein